MCECALDKRPFTHTHCELLAHSFPLSLSLLLSRVNVAILSVSSRITCEHQSLSQHEKCLFSSTMNQFEEKLVHERITHVFTVGEAVSDGVFWALISVNK